MLNFEEKICANFMKKVEKIITYVLYYIDNKWIKNTENIVNMWEINVSSRKSVKL